MRRRLVILGGVGLLIVCIGGILLVAVSEPGVAFDPNSPEGRAKASVRCGDLALTRAFTVREKRLTPQGALVLFTARCLSPGGFDEVYGYYLGGQQASSGGWARAAARPQQVAEVSTGSLQTDHDRQAIVYGRVRAANVTVVEATFDTGETAQAQVPGGVFALFGAGAQHTCELRTLDATGQVLDRIPLDAGGRC